MSDPAGNTDSMRLDPYAIVRATFSFLLGTTFKRVLSSTMALGVTVLGLSWVDLIALAVQVFGGAPQSGGGVTLLVQLVGIAMIAVGFGGHLLLFLKEQREERNAAEAVRRDAAANLVGRLRVLIAGFRDQSVTRDAGYYNQEIVDNSLAAKAFIAIAPAEFRADATLAALVTPKFDASKKAPLYGLEIAALEALANRIEAHYAIESQRT